MVPSVTASVTSISRLPQSRLLRRAFSAAEKAHHGQIRVSGEPYIEHPVAVAEMLARWGADDDIIAAGVLHDTVEDTDLCLGEIRHTFGNRIADIILLMSKPSSEAEPPVMTAIQTEMPVTMTSVFLHALFVKFCDRIHNLRTVAALSRERQRRMAVETIEVLYPAAVHVNPIVAETLRHLSQSVLMGFYDDGRRRVAQFIVEPAARLIQ